MPRGELTQAFEQSGLPAPTAEGEPCFFEKSALERAGADSHGARDGGRVAQWARSGLAVTSLDGCGRSNGAAAC